MADVFLFLFLLLCGIILCKVILHPERIYEYPYFMGSMFTVFIVPQALSIKINPGVAPPEAVSMTFLMCFLCLFMAVLGYSYGPGINIAKGIDYRIDLKKLLRVANVYAVFGICILVLMYKMAAMNTGRDWSGSALSIYNTLYQSLYIAFSIYTFLAIGKKKSLYILLACVTAVPILQMIIFAGRREPTTLFALTIVLALYFLKGVVLPRALIIGGLVFTMLIIPLIGSYRQAADSDPIAAMSSIDFKRDFLKYYEQGRDMELTVAAQSIDATTFYGSYDLGADYWNEMVFRYFPGQVFGKDAKSALMIGNRGLAAFKTDFVALNGLTPTCVGDSFQHFGYLGCLFYFLLGGVFRELWRLSAVSNLLVKTLYMVCMVQALISVSHGTVNFLPSMFHMFVFISIASLYARVKPVG